jgi:photosystem II stability/assembly factor-like uncharacterized protein
MKKTVAISLAILMLFSLFQGALRGSVVKAADYQWVPVNECFPAAYVTDLCIDPSNTQVIYAATKGGGVYKTVDGGSSWVQVNNGLTTLDVFPLVIDRKNPQILFACNTEGIFKSSEGALTWNELSDVSVAINVIVIYPTDSNLIYIGTENEGIFKSSDGGTTWTSLNNGLREYDFMGLPVVNTLYVDPSNKLNIYAGTSRGVFRTQDGGLNWVPINEGLKECELCSFPYVYSVKVSSSNSSIIYIGTSKGIFKSDNGGKGWSKMSEFSNISVNIITADKDDQNIYIGTENGVYTSKDFTNWKKLGKGKIEEPINALIVDPSRSQNLYVGTSEGVFKSIDGGVSWSTANNGLINVTISSIVSDPFDSNILFASTFGSGLYKTTDLGKQWFPVNDGLSSLSISSTVVDPKNSQVVLVGTDDGVFKSIDGGKSFQKISNGLSANIIYSLVIDPTNSQLLFAGTGKGIFKSTDGGTSWNEANVGMITDEFGVSVDVLTLAIDPQNSQIIYAGTSNRGIYKSVNAGNLWAPINEGLGDNIPPINAIAIDPRNSSVIYIGTDGSGAFKSENEGVSWEVINNLSAPWVYAICVDSSNSNTIFASFLYKGVFKSIDAGKTWVDISSGLPNKEIRSILIHKSGVIFVGTQIGPYKLLTSYTITSSANAGGKITPSGAMAVNNGDSKTFTLIPDSGFKISDVKVDEVSKGSISSYAFTNITSNHTIEATFEKEITQTVIVLQVGNLIYSVNGVLNTLDSSPVIKNSRTLLPIRAIIESLGGIVGWDSNEKKVTVTLGSTTIELWIGKLIAKINSVDTPIDSTNSKVVPEIINGRTMLPLRFVTENLGAKVDWEPSTQTITITYPGS